MCVYIFYLSMGLQKSYFGLSQVEISYTHILYISVPWFCGKKINTFYSARDQIQDHLTHSLLNYSSKSHLQI